MANELLVSAKLRFSKGGAKGRGSHSINVTVTGDAFTHHVQSIGTAEEETLEQASELGSPGYILIKNLHDGGDNDIYVKIGSTTGVYTIGIRGGEIALYRHNSATIYALAMKEACSIEYLLIED